MIGKNRHKLAEKVLNRLTFQNEYVAKPIRTPWKPNITISRDPGSGGRIIAKKVANKFGWEYWDKKLITRLAKEMGVPARVIRNIDEHSRSNLVDTLQSVFNPDYVSDFKYIKVLKAIMLKIGKKSYAVIVGRGASCIIPTDKALHIRIIGSKNTRVKKYAKYHKITKKEAREKTTKILNTRKAFIKQYFNKEIANPLNYDLIINTDNISLNTAASIITKAFYQKFPQKKTHRKK